LKRSPEINGAEPYVSFRHARIGRIGEAGQLPSGWRGEHLRDIEILDIGSRGPPWITLRVGFGADIPGHFAGLGLAAYLPAPKAARIGLTAEVSLGDGDNIGDVLLLVRELKDGGGLIGQATQSLAPNRRNQIGALTHGMTAEGCVAEPVVMIRRESAGPGGLTVTFRGLAFGNVGDYPRWRITTTGD
jgi:hypothetical protein